MDQIDVLLSKTTLIFRDIKNELVICERSQFRSCYRSGGDMQMGIVNVANGSFVSNHMIRLEVLDRLQQAFIEEALNER